MPTRAATYLDANASAPLHLKAREALNELFASGLSANPSSIHAEGRRSKRLLAEARERVALSLGPDPKHAADPEQIVFTSSGTEANQLAIRSVLEPRLARGERPHWITTRVEHDSVLQMAAWLRERGGTVDFLEVDSHGRIQLDALASLWRPETALVSSVWVNNETGVVTDVGRLASEVAARDVLLHVDAVQAWGKLPIDVARLGAHWVTLSGHKIGGLAGAGALWVRRGVQVQGAVLGKQEKGRRGGTENLAGIAAMGAAAAAIDFNFSSRVSESRDALEAEIRDTIPGVRVHGARAPRVGNVTNLGFEGLEGDGLVMALDLAGFCVSAGSACSSGAIEPSHVLLAMGLTRGQAMGAIRVSLFEPLDAATRSAFVAALASVVERGRGTRK